MKKTRPAIKGAHDSNHPLKRRRFGDPPRRRDPLTGAPLRIGETTGLSVTADLVALTEPEDSAPA
ncbi:MAG: hypothetical protein M1272_06235 [Firmicutes bacterium]|nr:hypothetical protein [Bacillota bacterium]